LKLGFARRRQVAITHGIVTDSPQFRSAPRWSIALLCGVVAAEGCALERSSMSMDSVSRSPFFGFVFAPKAKPPVLDRTISRDVRSRDVRRSESPVKVQTAVRDVEPERTWPNWLSLPGARPVVPLPRTDQAEPRGVAHATPANDETVIEF
jgi:hypothetical protein